MTVVEPTPTPGFLVYRLATKWQAAVDRAVSPFGITHAQYSVLASLRGMTRGGGRPSQREVADRLGLDPVFISKLVRTLEQSGFVERRDHPTDARAFALGLTDAGTRTIDPAIKVVIASGVNSAGYGDKRTEFRSYAELREILNGLEDELAELLGGRMRSRQVRMTTNANKGL